MGFAKNYYNEANLSTKERNKLKDSDFGIPETRQYPLIDKSHVISAIRFFNKCDQKYKKELANRIKKKAKEFGIEIAKDSPVNESFEKPILFNIEKSNITPEEFGEAFIILQEEAKYKKKYKCPYCDIRKERNKLISHIEKYHEDMISEEFTAQRIVFNLINKKETGYCVQCRRETMWNEEIGRYERYCSQKCIDEYKKIRDDRMMSKYNKLYLLDDVDFQNKMLANRKISGTYNFKGIEKSYVGSYELKALECYDKVLNLLPIHVQTPGPTIIYEYKGKQHKWIIDQYIVPFNLCIDIKDGGSNPNNRNMEEYRAKQIAKEKAIKEQGEFNYLRLTDNNFGQLLAAMVRIKDNIAEGINEKLWAVNEYMGGCSANKVCTNKIGSFVPLMVQNTFVDMAYATDRFLKNIYVIKDGKFVKSDINELRKKFDIGNKVLSYNTENTIIDDYLDKECTHETIYKIMTGRDLLDNKQYFLDGLHQVELEGNYEFEKRKEVIESTFEYIPNDSQIIVEENMLKHIYPDLCDYYGKYRDVKLENDSRGYFLTNTLTKNRSKYYEDYKNIEEEMFIVLQNM